VPGTHALALPFGAGPQQAPKLPGARQIRPVPRPQREVLVVAGQVTGLRAGTHHREPVVGVGPGCRLLRILAGDAEALRQLRELVAAPLADGGERD